MANRRASSDHQRRPQNPQNPQNYQNNDPPPRLSLDSRLSYPHHTHTRSPFLPTALEEESSSTSDPSSHSRSRSPRRSSPGQSSPDRRSPSQSAEPSSRGHHVSTASTTRLTGTTNPSPVTGDGANHGQTSKSFSLLRPVVSSGDAHSPTDSPTTWFQERVHAHKHTLAHKYRRWRRQYDKWEDKTSRDLSRFYQHFVVETLLRRKPLPPSRDGRHIPLPALRSAPHSQPSPNGHDPPDPSSSAFIDERTGQPYVSNFIRSSRYTVWDFVPKQLLFQFSKLANFYFLVIAILQMIPGLSTVGTYTTVVPLAIFIVFSMSKEGYDDYRRYTLDKVENRSLVWTLTDDRLDRPKLRHRVQAHLHLHPKSRLVELVEPSGTVDPTPTNPTDIGSLTNTADWRQKQWQQLRVGDILRLQRDDSVPADIVLLHATGPNGIAYVETMALDGETNLKSKQVSPLLIGQCDSVEKIRSCAATVVSEDPNLDLYSYDGRVTVGRETLPLTLTNIVYRGSMLRNTTLAIGVVVNTGEECKIRMNANKNVRAKKPAIQGLINRIVLCLVFIVVVLSMGLSGGYFLMQKRVEDKSWYIADFGADVKVSHIIMGYIIMFNTLIPLSLYVSLEIIKLGQFYLLGDVEMYDPVSDTPMVANTTTILENLGQVTHVFSDKTGTLTENIMRFRMMTVSGMAWLHDMDVERDENERQRKIAETMSRRKRKRHNQKGDKVRKSLQAGEAAALPPGKTVDVNGNDSDVSSSPSPSIRHMGMGGGERTAFPMTALPRKSRSERPSRYSLSLDTHKTSYQQDPHMASPTYVSSPLSPTQEGDVRSSFQIPRTMGPEEDGPILKTEDLLEYLRLRPHTAFARKARHFLLCLALCHTCLPETSPTTGEIVYQAASPDELALVEAAKELGFIVVDRPAQEIVLQIPEAQGGEGMAGGSSIREVWKVLEVIEFTSKRKRMSILVRGPDGRILLLCKGADNVILPRLRLKTLATQKAREVERRASVRKTTEQEYAQHRLSMGGGGATPRTSFSLMPRPSLSTGPSVAAGQGRTSMSMARPSLSMQRGSFHGVRPGRYSVEGARSPRMSRDDWRSSGFGIGNNGGGAAVTGTGHVPATPRQSLGLTQGEYLDGMVDESLASNEGLVFERCFQHVNEFARQGLRTLLYGYRYLDEQAYAQWHQTYQEASTSLVDRQEKIEAAGEMIEQALELAGATAIEDKLQYGVPETIDKLRRANINVWMITGDKRETAVNIGHSAGICLPISEVYVLDASATNEGDRDRDESQTLEEQLRHALNEVSRGMVPHSVVVIDGQTLSVLEEDRCKTGHLDTLFLELAVMADSVICCRASPSQKASLVRRVRRHVPQSMTLAIGDGANDISMIQASHVGIGVSGREGLQAARIADYSLAQFRFLQRLLFVHGRWNYMRTGKYVLATFWKEIFFFTAQAYYQRDNSYSGTSLYENWSLTVFNGLFTALPVIIMGIFDKDLSAKTLLAVPELYRYGQTNRAFNFRLWIGWMVLGTVESALLYFLVRPQYIWAAFPTPLDTSLYAMGTIPFSVAVMFINVKLLVLEMHAKTVTTAVALFLSVAGWWLWNVVLCVLPVIPRRELRVYQVRDSFLQHFGRQLAWWTTVALVFAALMVVELVVAAVRRVYWPEDLDWMQRLEKEPGGVDRLVAQMHPDADADAEADGSNDGIDTRTSEGLRRTLAEE